MSEIRIIKGNIFNSNMKTIVNTVNCVGFMGAGIALDYKRRYPDMHEEYKINCKNNDINIGELSIYKKSKPWILNFPTKIHYKDPSKISYIEKGLNKFIDIYEDEEIDSIAFPQLGSSLGGLDWDDVLKVMLRYLQRLNNIDIEIYEYDPAASDNLFDSLFEFLKDFTVDDYKKYLNINQKVAIQIKKSLGTNIRSMRDFEYIKGLGDATLEKLYNPEIINNYQENLDFDKFK